jgi:hypothetical protein
MLGEQERARFELVHDADAWKDARRRLLDLVGAAHHQPVSPLDPLGLDEVAPVRLRVSIPARVVLYFRNTEVAVEVRDETREPQRTKRRAAASDWRVVKTPSKRSPYRSIRPRTTSMVNACGSSSSLTSCQRSGVETGAPAFGRTE